MTTNIEDAAVTETTELQIDETPALTVEDIDGLALQFPAEPTPEPFAGDDTATWHYWSDMDTAERGVSTDWVWERLRLRRDGLLAATDFRMVADAPWDVEPWATYRQALRDLPDATTNPRVAVWPIAP